MASFREKHWRQEAPKGKDRYIIRLTIFFSFLIILVSFGIELGTSTVSEELPLADAFGKYFSKFRATPMAIFMPFIGGWIFALALWHINKAEFGLPDK